MQFYLKKILKDPHQGEFTKVLIQKKDSSETILYNLNKDLMDLSMEHDFMIEGDPQAKILVYTRKNKTGEIGHTVKAYYAGDQKNLFLDEYSSFVEDVN